VLPALAANTIVKTKKVRIEEARKGNELRSLLPPSSSRRGNNDRTQGKRLNNHNGRKGGYLETPGGGKERDAWREDFSSLPVQKVVKRRKRLYLFYTWEKRKGKDGAVNKGGLDGSPRGRRMEKGGATPHKKKKKALRDKGNAAPTTTHRGENISSDVRRKMGEKSMQRVDPH